MKYFLEIAYKGTRYHGWQLQENAHSVQAELNQALKYTLRQEVETIGSGRTDTGVHCKQQFVHFEVEALTDIPKILYQLNKCLPEDIYVHQIREVHSEAHARFDALSRSYEYHITQVKDPFSLGLAYFYPQPLAIHAMNEAAKALFNYEDFEAFSKVKTDVKHFRCNIYRADWEVVGKHLIFHIKANRFLRGMVRTIVGTLLDVGRGQQPIESFEKIIQTKTRRQAGRAVPPQGLYLTAVEYPFL